MWGLGRGGVTRSQAHLSPKFVPFSVAPGSGDLPWGLLAMGCSPELQADPHMRQKWHRDKVAKSQQASTSPPFPQTRATAVTHPTQSRTQEAVLVGPSASFASFTVAGNWVETRKNPAC